MQQDATHAAGTPNPLQWVLVSAWAVGGLTLAMRRGWLHQARVVRWRTNQLGDQMIMVCGLLVSGMVNPAKVLGFLDVAGRWDPSLALVMVGAIAVGTIAFFFAGRWAETILHAPMQLPKVSAIDGRLVFGSTLFGAARCDGQRGVHGLPAAPPH